MAGFFVSAGPETFSGELDGTQEVIGGLHETDLNGEVSAFFILDAGLARGRVEPEGMMTEDLWSLSLRVRCRRALGGVSADFVRSVLAWDAGVLLGLLVAVRSPFVVGALAMLKAGSCCELVLLVLTEKPLSGDVLGAEHGERAVSALRWVPTVLLLVLAVLSRVHVIRLSLSTWSLHRHVSSRLTTHCMEMCLHEIHIIHLHARCTVCIVLVVL